MATNDCPSCRRRTAVRRFSSCAAGARVRASRGARRGMEQPTAPRANVNYLLADLMTATSAPGIPVRGVRSSRTPKGVMVGDAPWAPTNVVMLVTSRATERTLRMHRVDGSTRCPVTPTVRAGDWFTPDRATRAIFAWGEPHQDEVDRVRIWWRPAQIIIGRRLVPFPIAVLTGRIELAARRDSTTISIRRCPSRRPDARSASGNEMWRQRSIAQVESLGIP